MGRGLEKRLGLIAFSKKQPLALLLLFLCGLRELVRRSYRKSYVRFLDLVLSLASAHH